MLDKIAKVAAALIAVVFVACAACYANNQIDPAQYPETITVMAESKETATKDLAGCGKIVLELAISWSV